ncbi:hypothetical protein N9Z18_02475 [Verrucomicrobiales bacterium]|jgi:hypothetical protein|nr:hypothetical protein [Verrucomicrobiales bacterium]
MKALLFLILSSVFAATLTSCMTKSEANANIKPYPFDNCAVIQKPLKGRTIIRRVHDGQEVLFCCRPCVKAFEANPEPYMARIRSATPGGAEPPHVAGGERAAAEAAAEMGRNVR